MIIQYITNQNLGEAAHATRSILNLYNEIITGYGGFIYNHHQHSFDAFKYLQCRINLADIKTIKLDLDLLHKGSAVALLCRLDYDITQLINSKNHLDNLFMNKIIQQLEKGAFDLLPLAKDAVLSACEDRDIYKTKLRLIYEEYVLGYYRKISSYRDQGCSIFYLSHYKKKIKPIPFVQ